MNPWDELVERVRKAAKWRSPSERRVEAVESAAYNEALTTWLEGDRQENFVEPAFAEDDSAHGLFLEKLGFSAKAVDEGDPYEEGRSFLDACEKYDRRLESELRSLREYGATTSDESKRRRVARRIEWIEAERDGLEKVTSQLWGRIFRPSAGVYGKPDEDAKVLAELRCRCSEFCPRLFRDRRAGNAAGWRHPSCREEAAAKRRAEADGVGAYIEGLLSRLL